MIDGTQWDIQLIEYGKIYSGSNDFPEEYDNVIKLLNKYFNTDLFIKEKDKLDNLEDDYYINSEN